MKTYKGLHFGPWDVTLVMKMGYTYTYAISSCSIIYWKFPQNIQGFEYMYNVQL